MDQFHEFKEKVDKKLQKYEKLNELEQQTGVDKFFFAAGAVVIGGLILYLVGGTRLIVNLVGFFYPAYMSFKAIGTADKQDDKQWLTYWIVYGIFDLSEQTTSLLENWIPFYFVLKAAFLVWCYHPSTRGAEKLYSSLIRPQLSSAGMISKQQKVQ